MFFIAFFCVRERFYMGLDCRARLSLSDSYSEYVELAIKLQFSLSAHSGQIEIEMNAIACRSHAMRVSFLP